jgi:pilus assembly protein CpaB
MNIRRTTVLIALLLALGTAWLTMNYIGSIQHNALQDSQPRVVFIASQDIPARVTITPDMLKRTIRPAGTLDPDALSDASKLIGSLSLITIPAGSTITGSKIGRPADVGLPVRLRPGMRAVSISIDKVKGVSGLVQPGDFVDVVAIPPGAGPSLLASTILRGLRVLAVGPMLEDPSATPSPAEQSSTTVTLEVTPKQVDLLEMADAKTELRLSLRSPREPLNSLPVEHLGSYDMSGIAVNPMPGAVPSIPSGPMSVPTAVATPAPASHPILSKYASVDIIDGDHVTPGHP